MHVLAVGVLLVMAGLPSLAHAQTETRIPDEEWAALVALSLNEPSAPSFREEDSSTKAARSARLQEVAAEAADFVRRFPTDARAGRAKGLEARSGLVAALLEGEQPTEEMKALAAEVRQDFALSREERYEIAFLSEMTASSGRRFEDRTEWLVTREKIARSLIAEFPGLPGGWSLLLQVAERSGREKTRALANEIAVSEADPRTKAKAQVLVDRMALSGQRLPAILDGVPGVPSGLDGREDRPVILYTWSPDDAASIALAKELANVAPPDAVIVGVNLGPDVPKAVAAAAELPGVQLYGCRGFDSPLVLTLHLASAPLVYLVDREGVVRSTDAHRDLASQISSMEGGR